MRQKRDFDYPDDRFDSVEFSNGAKRVSTVRRILIKVAAFAVAVSACVVFAGIFVKYGIFGANRDAEFAIETESVGLADADDETASSFDDAPNVAEHIDDNDYKQYDEYSDYKDGDNPEPIDLAQDDFEKIESADAGVVRELESNDDRAFSAIVSSQERRQPPPFAMEKPGFRAPFQERLMESNDAFGFGFARVDVPRMAPASLGRYPVEVAPPARDLAQAVEGDVESRPEALPMTDSTDDSRTAVADLRETSSTYRRRMGVFDKIGEQKLLETATIAGKVENIAETSARAEEPVAQNGVASTSYVRPQMTSRDRSERDVALSVLEREARSFTVMILAFCQSSKYSNQTANQPFVGFIFEYRNGLYVCSCAHPFENVHSIEDVAMRFGNETTGRPTVVLCSFDFDVAVLGINPEDVDLYGLKAAPIAEPGRCAEGETIYAMGFPNGRPWTLSRGAFVCGDRLKDDVYGELSLSDSPIPAGGLLQLRLEAHIGDSGGPAFTLDGVIGMRNCCIRNKFSTPTDSSIGDTSLATDVCDALALAIRMIDEGEESARESSIGSSFVLARGSSRAGGAEVESVVPNSPAESAGLRPGDLITTVNGEKVVDGESLRREIAFARAGTVLELDFVRGTERSTISVVARPKDELNSITTASY